MACGNSSKQANLFEFDKPTLLSNMQVSQVCSLGLRRDPLISPENDLDYVTQIAKQYLDTDSEKEDKASASIATFGINQTVQFDHVEHGEVGLAISSSALALKESLREITLTVLLADPFKIAEHNLALFCQSDGRSEAIDYLSLIFADLLDAEPHFLALVEQSVCAVHAHLSHEQRLRFCAEYLTGQLCVCQIDELMQVTTDLAALVIHKHFLIVLLVITQQEHAFSRVLGRIFSRQTLLVQHRAAALNGSWLSEKDLSLINKKASQLPQSANLTRLLRLLSQSQVRTFMSYMTTCLTSLYLRLRAGMASIAMRSHLFLTNCPPAFKQIMAFVLSLNSNLRWQRYQPVKARFMVKSGLLNNLP